MSEIICYRCNLMGNDKASAKYQYVATKANGHYAEGYVDEEGSCEEHRSQEDNNVYWREELIVDPGTINI